MLNIEQIQEVATYLASFSKLSKANQEELLDHLCCDIENAMMQGQSFNEALLLNQERLNESEVKKIHSSNQSKFIMAKLFIGALMLASVALSSFDFIGTAVPVEDIAISNPLEVVPLEPPSICPLSTADFKLSSAFGPSIHPITQKKRMHQGVDWKAPTGTPIQSAGDGIVLEAGDKGKYGNCIIIVHDDMYQTLYAHLESIDVKEGDKVALGQRIGTVGSTGMSTGAHLHYEVIRNGVKVNPLSYIP